MEIYVLQQYPDNTLIYLWRKHYDIFCTFHMLSMTDMMWKTLHWHYKKSTELIAGASDRGTVPSHLILRMTGKVTSFGG